MRALLSGWGFPAVSVMAPDYPLDSRFKQPCRGMGACGRALARKHPFRAAIGDRGVVASRRGLQQLQQVSAELGCYFFDQPCWPKWPLARGPAGTDHQLFRPAPAWRMNRSLHIRRSSPDEVVPQHGPPARARSMSLEARISPVRGQLRAYSNSQRRHPADQRSRPRRHHRLATAILPQVAPDSRSISAATREARSSNACLRPS